MPTHQAVGVTAENLPISPLDLINSGLSVTGHPVHMFADYDGVLKIDGEVGNKKVYDPRAGL